MVEANIKYLGNKRCELTHLQSGSKIETDAPKDNLGLGEKFSPTDLVAVALGSCIVTTMAIVAEREKFEFLGAEAKVIKEMNATPRRIAQIAIHIKMSAKTPENLRARLERVATECPVHKSLHPDVKIPIQFEYSL
jgi:putative redox protein